MLRGYLFAGLLILLGLTGVGFIAVQASARMGNAPPPASPRRAGPGRADAPTVVDAGVVARPAADAAAPATSADAAVAARPAADAVAPATAVDAGVAVTALPDAAAPAPPPRAGPEPAAVIEFSEASVAAGRADVKAVRGLVERFGYRDADYALTPYAGERPSAAQNQALARKRCQEVAQLVRRSGVSRRWITCKDPVVPDPHAVKTDAAWRKVEIHVVKR